MLTVAMLVALSTAEPPILDRETTRLLERNETWYEQRMRGAEDRIRVRLGAFPRASAVAIGSMARSAPAT